MRVHVLLALGLLATVSPATAQPEEAGARVRYRPGEVVRPSRSERDWVRIASPTPTKWGTEYIVIGRDAGWFRSLRIDAVSGTVVVRRLAVLTRHHAWRTFYVNRRLDRRHPSLYVDLGGSVQLSQVIVTTDRRIAGAYTIYASSGRTAPVLVARR